jgi:hypothetical protein
MWRRWMQFKNAVFMMRRIIPDWPGDALKTVPQNCPAESVVQVNRRLMYMIKTCHSLCTNTDVMPVNGTIRFKHNVISAYKQQAGKA